MNTLLVATDTWDLITDASGNIAMASTPYSTAQDVASAIKLYLGELYYDQTQGIPYAQNILGQRPSMQYIKAQMEQAALTVPGAVTAVCTLTGFKGRSLGGNVLITDTNGAETYVKF